MNDIKTAMNIQKVSVIIPVYNEERAIESLHEDLTAVLEKINKKYEIIYVDDCSQDNSLNVLNKIFKTKESAKLALFCAGMAFSAVSASNLASYFGVNI